MSEIRVENIIGETGTDAVKFTKGINVTGIVTATNVSIGSSVTATNFFGSGAGLSGVSAGKVLQVVQATKTDTASSVLASGGTWVPTTPKCSITPSNASNKILVQATANISVNADSHGMHLTVLKAGALMFVGNADGSRQRVTTATFHHTQYRSGFLHFNYLDTAGGTSAIEYSLRFSHDSGSNQTMYLNRTVANDNTDDRPLGATSIVLMEIEA